MQCSTWNEDRVQMLVFRLQLVTFNSSHTEAPFHCLNTLCKLTTGSWRMQAGDKNVHRTYSINTCNTIVRSWWPHYWFPFWTFLHSSVAQIFSLGREWVSIFLGTPSTSSACKCRVSRWCCKCRVSWCKCSTVVVAVVYSGSSSGAGVAVLRT